MLTFTPSNDYFGLVFRWLTLGQTELIHTLKVLPIYSLNHKNYFRKICFIEMREKLHSQRDFIAKIVRLMYIK